MVRKTFCSMVALAVLLASAGLCPAQGAAKPVAVVSFAGYDAGGRDECSERGWMVLEGDTLTGMFFFHLGDESEIVLKRTAETPKKRKSRGAG